MYVCMYVCRYVRMHACMHLCVYVCMKKRGDQKDTVRWKNYFLILFHESTCNYSMQMVFVIDNKCCKSKHKKLLLMLCSVELIYLCQLITNVHKFFDCSVYVHVSHLGNICIYST
jgi:hypothetical protein